MRKYQALFLSLILCITSCVPINISKPTLTPNVRATYIPSFDAFQIDTKCPHICWLGIYPGTTSAEEAIRLIKNSNQFDQLRTRQEDSAIVAYWSTEKTSDYMANIYIALSDGIVKSITISHIEPFTVDDFIHLLGTPDRISFFIGKYPYEGGLFTAYRLYYASLQAEIYIEIPEVRGPKPVDFVDILYLGTEFDDRSKQPWMGYRSLEEYFPKGTPTVQPPNPYQ